MTDRFHTLTVVLDCNIRNDDAEPIIDAIRQIRHVLDVTGEVANLESHMAEARAKQDLRNKLWDLLK